MHLDHDLYRYVPRLRENAMGSEVALQMGQAWHPVTERILNSYGQRGERDDPQSKLSLPSGDYLDYTTSKSWVTVVTPLPEGHVFRLQIQIRVLTG